MSINNPNSSVGVSVSNSTSIAGSYTNSNITVNQQGIITNISNGGNSALGHRSLCSNLTQTLTGDDYLSFESTLSNDGTLTGLTVGSGTWTNDTFTNTSGSTMVLLISCGVCFTSGSASAGYGMRTHCSANTINNAQSLNEVPIIFSDNNNLAFFSFTTTMVLTSGAFFGMEFFCTSPSSLTIGIANANDERNTYLYITRLQ